MTSGLTPCDSPRRRTGRAEPGPLREMKVLRSATRISALEGGLAQVLDRLPHVHLQARHRSGLIGAAQGCSGLRAAPEALQPPHSRMKSSLRHESLTGGAGGPGSGGIGGVPGGGGGGGLPEPEGSGPHPMTTLTCVFGAFVLGEWPGVTRMLHLSPEKRHACLCSWPGPCPRRGPAQLQ